MRIFVSSMPRLAIAVAVVSVVFIGSTSTRGDEGTTASGSSGDEKPDAEEESERRRNVGKATAALAAIALLGAALIALAVFWGRRTHRLVRKPLPEQSAGDPLWYLKNKDTSSVDPQERDESSGEERDGEP